MQIFSTFDHSSYLELAISLLESKGISSDHILAVPLEASMEEYTLFDTIHQSDGISLFDTGAALATAFAVIGASIGFMLKWGPIYWGLIGASIGFILGFIINYLYYRVYKKRQKQQTKNEVILIVDCIPEQVDMVKNIFKHHFAKGIAVLPY
ncbi:hypothetical protein FZC66_04995 [Priestia megaterium]|nr:hypothetical protein FZC66_04995 [Priestia megaterium]